MAQVLISLKQMCRHEREKRFEQFDLLDESALSTQSKIYFDAGRAIAG